MSLDIRHNLIGVQRAITEACKRAGRSRDEVQLIAVSKTVEIEGIRAVISEGVRTLGENRVQEARHKIEILGQLAVWHLIGHLQTNKAKDAIRLFDWVHSLDRIELAKELDRRAIAARRTINVLIEVNIGEEPQKSGVRPEEVKPLLDAAMGLQGIRIRGLMAIPPIALNAEQARPYFRRLRELRDEAGLEHLSMGMSSDFEVAIEEGATMVRLGTAIFGPRKEVSN